MLKPRPLPPAHKNQLFVPVKTFGFYDVSNNRSLTPNLFRNHEIARKKVKPYPEGVFAPSGFDSRDTDDDTKMDKETSPRSKDSMTSLIHIRGRASRTDVTESIHLHDVRRKTPKSENDDDETKLTSFLTDDPTSSRSYDGRSTSFSPFLECSKYNMIGEPRFLECSKYNMIGEPRFLECSKYNMIGEPRFLECSKYNMIGEPRFRKTRLESNTWRLPNIAPSKGSVEQYGASDPKTNSIDLRSIYGARSKLLQVPPADVVREDTVMLPPLQVGRRREEAERGVDCNSLAERRLVMDNNRRHSVHTQILQDHVAFPAVYRPYFRFRQRQHSFVRSLFARDDFWENNRQPVHCCRCDHQTTATLHYCDVLGKRFCRFCAELSDRTFSRHYEDSRLLAPSPNKSPTLRMLTEEPSFVGVRKIVITKRVKDDGAVGCQGQGQMEKT